ncbi:MAG: hypothetical protein K9K32_00210 [Halanaerobiales bacterium]|nr:hypothetical protein [Halanaerobiales bacterium]
MKFTVDKDVFQSNIRFLNKITKNFDFNNIADSLLFKLKDDKLIIQAMNDLSAAKTTIPMNKEFLNTEFLVDANKFYKVIRFASQDTLMFELDAEDTQKGEGHLIFRGKSTVKFPLKPLFQYPTYNKENLYYTPVDKEFIEDLDIAKEFIHKKATNYLSGININSNTIISSNKIVVMLIKHKYNFDKYHFDSLTIPSDTTSIIKALDDPEISFSSSFYVKGKIKDCKVETYHNVINDDYPADLILQKTHKWGNEKDKHKVVFRLDDLKVINKKINSVNSKDDMPVKLEVKEGKITFKYRENKFTFQQTIEAETETPLVTKMRCARIDNLVSLASFYGQNKISLFFKKEDTSEHFIFKDKFLYVAELQELTIKE